MRWLPCCLVLACSGSTGAPVTRPAPVLPDAAVALAPEGDDFDAASVGAMPDGWRLEAVSDDVTFSVIDDRGGRVLVGSVTGEGSGTLRKALDVARYRGQRVALDGIAMLSPEVWWARAAIGLEITRDATPDYDDFGPSRRIEVPAWRPYRAIVDVPDDATGLDLIVRVAGASMLAVDDLSVTVLGASGAGDEPPRALDGRARDNVVAFARLYGAVRYFHPSDEAAALTAEDWERFVVRGVRAVEAAADAAALATTLGELFAPIAPTVAVWSADEPPATPSSGAQVRWLHSGLGMDDLGGSIYASKRGDATTVVRYTTVTTTIDAQPLRGKTVRVVVPMRAELRDTADAGVWMLVARESGEAGFYTEPEMQPAPAAGWHDYAVDVAIDADATQITFGIQAIGDARVVAEPPRIAGVTIPSWGKKALAPAWMHSGERDDLYDIVAGAKGCAKKRPCLAITPRAVPELDLSPWRAELAGGVTVRVPVVMDHDGTRTQPAATASLPASDDVLLLASDRAVRLAAVIIAWNIPRHFYPYFDVVPADWPAELPRALARAAEDAGTRDLHETLRLMMAGLHDGHGFVSHPAEPRTHFAPWSWEHVEGSLVITKVSAQCQCDLAAGDVVTSIDDQPIADAIADATALQSAATPQHAAWGILYDLRAGPPGPIRLGVTRGGVAHVVDAERQQGLDDLTEERPAQGTEVAPGIRYVDIDSLTDAAWERILPDLAAAEVVVVDVRGYPGSFPLGAPLAHMTDHQLRSPLWLTPTPARPDEEGMTFTEGDWAIEPAAPRIAKLVFLTDGRAVSAAETWMAIVEHDKLGPIVGATTAGTNGNINPFSVPGGFQVWWTGLKVLKRDRTTYHGVGVAPTVPAERTIAGVTAGRDEVLEAAIAVAKQQQKPKPKP